MRDPRSHLIVALDVPDSSTAIGVVNRLAGHVGSFKLGLEIFVAEGPRLVDEILASGEKVFLDLKLHDIPNTVAGAVRSACRLGVDMLTLHAAGGGRMMEAARDAAMGSASPPLLLAVTALTSLSPGDTRSIGMHLTIPEWADRLAELACQSGIPGLVASPLELSALHPKFGSKMQFVTPGIRPAGTSAQDQARTATPREAMLAGADFIVVGRPILQAPDPVGAAERVVAEIAEALRAGARG